MKNIVPLIFIVLAIATYYVYISPQYEKIKLLRIEEAEHIQAQAEAEELTKTYDRLATEYNNLSQEDIDRLNTFLPDVFDATRFAMDVDNLAARYGIEIRGVEATQTTAPTTVENTSKAFETHTIGLKFKAPYQNFVQFMKDIEKNLNIMDVTRVAFVSTDTGIYEFVISLQTYSLK